MKYSKKRVTSVVIGVLLLFSLAFGVYQYFSYDNATNLNMVSGTEYISGELGQVIVRLTDYKSQPINNAECNVTILYPDKSYFMLDQSLQLSSEQGNYYREFLTPTINGIYEETITCSRLPEGSPSTTTVSSSFHVSPALNFIVEMSVLQAERYWDLVQRINQTQAQINSTRDKILLEINETFSYDILQRLAQSEGNLSVQINKSQQELNQSVSEMFDSLNTRMVNLGNTLVTIFSE